MWAVFFMRRPVQRKYAAKAAHGPSNDFFLSIIACCFDVSSCAKLNNSFHS